MKTLQHVGHALELSRTECEMPPRRGAKRDLNGVALKRETGSKYGNGVIKEAKSAFEIEKEA